MKFTPKQINRINSIAVLAGDLLSRLDYDVSCNLHYSSKYIDFTLRDLRELYETLEDFAILDSFENNGYLSKAVKRAIRSYEAMSTHVRELIPTRIVKFVEDFDEV